MTVLIHPTAIISDGAQIGEGTTIGPYSIIGPKVVLGQRNIIAAHVVIEGHTSIGNENHIFQFASIGSIPQDLKYKGEDSHLKIGNRNKIREYVTMQPGTSGGGMLTSVGDDNLFMANSHLGHDSHVGNKNIIANSVALAGHVTIEDRVTVGGLAAVHQFVKLGELSFIGGGAMVTKDIPPFCMAQGDRAGLVGLNTVGLERSGSSNITIDSLKRAYREIFISSGLITAKLEAARINFKECRLSSQLISFISASSRGCALPRKKGVATDDNDAE